MIFNFSEINKNAKIKSTNNVNLARKYKAIQYYCNALPISNLTDHRMLMFGGVSDSFFR